MQITVSEHASGRKVRLEVEPHHTIGSVIDVVVDGLNLSMNETYCIVYNGHQLNKDRTMKEGGIREGSSLTLTTTSQGSAEKAPPLRSEAKPITEPKVKPPASSIPAAEDVKPIREQEPKRVPIASSSLLKTRKRIFVPVLLIALVLIASVLVITRPHNPINDVVSPFVGDWMNNGSKTYIYHLTITRNLNGPDNVHAWNGCFQDPPCNYDTGTTQVIRDGPYDAHATFIFPGKSLRLLLHLDQSTNTMRVVSYTFVEPDNYTTYFGGNTVPPGAIVEYLTRA